MHKELKFWVFLLAITCLIACKQNKKPVAKLSPAEMQQLLIEYNKQLSVSITNEIDTYIDASGVAYTKLDVGLYYAITQNGNGKKVQAGDRIKAELQFVTIDSIAIKSTGSKYAQEFTAGKHQIPALNELVGFLDQNCTASIVVPPHLGFGMNGSVKGLRPARPFLMTIVLLKVN